MFQMAKLPSLCAQRRATPIVCANLAHRLDRSRQPRSQTPFTAEYVVAAAASWPCLLVWTAIQLALAMVCELVMRMLVGQRAFAGNNMLALPVALFSTRAGFLQGKVQHQQEQGCAMQGAKEMCLFFMDSEAAQAYLDVRLRRSFRCCGACAFAGSF